MTATEYNYIQTFKAVDGWYLKPSSHCFSNQCTNFELELTQLFILPFGICIPGLIISINRLI